MEYTEEHVKSDENSLEMTLDFDNGESVIVKVSGYKDAMYALKALHKAGCDSTLMQLAQSFAGYDSEDGI